MKTSAQERFVSCFPRGKRFSALQSYTGELEVFLAKVSGSPAKFPARLLAQSQVDLFERAVKSGKRVFQVTRAATGLGEVAVVKLAGAGDHRSAHGTVFMRSLRPDGACGLVKPKCEPHTCLKWEPHTCLKCEPHAGFQ